MTSKEEEQLYGSERKIEIKETEVCSEQISPFWRQLLAASPPTIASISSGMLFGYSATLIPELQKPDSEIKVTLERASWIASTVPLLMSLGCLVGGPIMGKYGRKKAHYILCVPKFIGWLTIYFAPDFTTLLIGRILGGFSCGLLATLFPTHLGEVSEPKYRGLFLVGPSVALALGIFAAHILGTFLNWRLVALLASVLPLTTALVVFFIPETPCWLVTQDRFNDAFKAFRWLRGNSVASRREFEEMWENHKESKNDSNEGFFQKMHSTFSRPEFVKPFAIIFCCFFTMQFSGPYTVAFYSVNILEKVLGTHMDEYFVMNAIDILRLVMVFIAAILLRIVRRRVLLLVSGSGTTISALALAFFLYGSQYYSWLHEFGWVSVIILVSYIFFVSIGIFVLPWCVAGELYPIDCRSIGSSLNTSINFFLFFIGIKTAPALFESIGMDGTFLCYGLICLTGTIILGMVLPETKNRTLVEIEMHFTKKKNPTNV